jgi:hypothetical protein
MRRSTEPKHFFSAAPGARSGSMARFGTLSDVPLPERSEAAPEDRLAFDRRGSRELPRYAVIGTR